MSKVKLTLCYTLCNHEEERVEELPVSPDYDCPKCENEGSLYITSIDEE
jgi:hypothetical protein